MRVLLFRGKGRGPVANMICWQTRSPYHHAALEFYNGLNYYIIESYQGKGVQETTLKSMDGVDAFMVKDMGIQQTYEAEAFAQAQLGHRYDYRGVFRFLTRKPAEENGKWFCSELVFAALQAAGINLLQRIDPWAVSPGHLALSPLLVEVD